ncbi:hypothetical protein MMSR116_11685 [Methylobacterium mesophilicum SR1.6/6]|uniref:Uncharacterized protein n=1 Tax=Methylobacterium mesophilicum SR1.6/6 TaxID=908290 RepID=A0A6B9FIR6_9HYPH|nr:hypothetical protein [Methylobacterium mesophilicum]QGY02460.1 hypothetical protein MMSR116_11685 [Methylobacterium mesophilicum SR1.6/6]
MRSWPDRHDPASPPGPKIPSLDAAFRAGLRVRGFAGDLTMTEADRTVLAMDISISAEVPRDPSAASLRLAGRTTGLTA